MKWQDIRVGDIVHLSNNETVPADILLLRTSDSQGVCYIDTCDLDGETNLKRREVSSKTDCLTSLSLIVSNFEYALNSTSHFI